MKARTKIIALALAIVLVGCAGLGIWYLQTESFQESVRAILLSRIELATGLDCKIEHFKLNVFRGQWAIEGLELFPKKPLPGPIRLKVSEIRFRIGLSSLWRFRIHLAELNIVRPQIELLSGSGESTWNPEEMLKTLKMSLRLEAGKVTIEEGRLRVNKRDAPFQLSMDDLDCEIRYSKELPSYKIHVEYKRSKIYWERRNIVHDLDLFANLSLQGLAIEYFKLRRGDSLLTGDGSMVNWNAPAITIHIDGILDARDLKLATPSLHEGRGNIGIQVKIYYDRNGVRTEGRFTARNGGYRQMNYRNLSGNFEIRQDVLYLRDVSGRIANGYIQGKGDIQLRAANKEPNRVILHTKNVPVIEAGRLLNLPLLRFENTADATTILTWHGDQPLTAECDVNLHGWPQSEANSGKDIFLDGNIRFTYVDTGAVFIPTANLHSPYTDILISGGTGDSFHIGLSTTRISEPLKFIAGFSAPVADLLARQPDLSQMAGAFGFNGDIQIRSSAEVQYWGGITIKKGHWRSYNVDTFSSRAHFKYPLLKLQSMVIHRGSQQAEGDLDLELAEREAVSDFRFNGNIQQVPLSALKDFGVEAEKIDGILSGSGSIQYQQGVWDGRGQIAIEKGNYNGEPFDRVGAQLQLANQRLQIMHAEARRSGTRLSAEGEFNLSTQQLNLTTNLQGFSLKEIPVIQERRLPLEGRVSISGSLTGTFQDPSFIGAFELDSLRYDRWDLGNGKGRIGFEKGMIKGNARIQSDLGNLDIRTQISTSAGYPGNAILEFADLDIQKIIPSKTPDYLKEVGTALNGKVEIIGAFNDWASLKMRGEVDGAHFKVHDYQLRNDGRIRFAIQNQNLLVENACFIGDGTRLTLSGTFPLDDNPRLDLALKGSLNLQLLEKIEKKVEVAGAAALDIRASGSRRNPQIIGRATFQDVRLDYAEFPVRFSAMRGDIVFSKNLIRLENVRGAAASGTVQVSGVVEHQNAVLRSINLGISIQNARLPYPKDFRSVVNAELILSGNSDINILGGEIDVTRMEYVRSFNLMEQLASRSAVQTGPLTTDPYLLGLRLNVEIHSDNGFYIDNELTRLRASLRLTLRGTPAYPSLTGRMEASEGTIFFRGNRFEIMHAAANFVDRNRINPVLEIRAEADVKTYRLILDANGELEHLNLNVSSDPPMSTVDILSLLTTGKTDNRSATSQRESQMAGVSAASVLSENLTGVIGKRVQRIFGFESFRVDPFLAGAENDPTARLTISERISKDLVVTFSRNLSTNQEQIVVIEYDVGRNLSMVATRDENGKYGLDFRFRKRLR